MTEKENHRGKTEKIVAKSLKINILPPRAPRPLPGQRYIKDVGCLLILMMTQKDD